MPERDGWGRADGESTTTVWGRTKRSESRADLAVQEEEKSRVARRGTIGAESGGGSGAEGPRGRKAGEPLGTRLEDVRSSAAEVSVTRHSRVRDVSDRRGVRRGAFRQALAGRLVDPMGCAGSQARAEFATDVRGDVRAGLRDVRGPVGDVGFKPRRVTSVRCRSVQGREAASCPGVEPHHGEIEPTTRVGLRSQTGRDGAGDVGIVALQRGPRAGSRLLPPCVSDIVGGKRIASFYRIPVRPTRHGRHSRQTCAAGLFAHPLEGILTPRARRSRPPGDRSGIDARLG